MTNHLKLDSIQWRLGLLFLAFVLLVSVSVGVTFWGLESQKKDALVINLAGRQRMLIQQITRLAGQKDSAGGVGTATEMLTSADTFEETLNALQNGGAAPYSPGQTQQLPPADDPIIQAQLTHIRQIWNPFRQALERAAGARDDSVELSVAARTVVELSTQLVEQADLAVRLYEAEATKKIVRLRSVQIGFFSGAVILLAVGVWVTHRSVLTPLKRLGLSAGRIGAGDLETTINLEAPKEINLLAQSFDWMRSDLKTSREELIDWAVTLEKRVSQRTRELEALYQVNREMTSHLDVQHVLVSVTEKVRELLEGDIAALCTLEQEGKSLLLEAHSGPSKGVEASVTDRRTALEQRVIMGEGAVACEGASCSGNCRIIADNYRGSHLAAPLRANNQVIGALCVGSERENAFDEDQTRLLTRLANSAAVALENARLYAQAERVAALEERQRIAADMHDSLAQSLSYLGLSIDQACDLLVSGEDEDACRRLERARVAIDNASDEVRSAIANMMDETPLDQSLQLNLENLVNEYSQRGGVVVEWVHTEKTPVSLPRDESEQVLRIVNETLINVENHAEASWIRIGLKCVNGDNLISVEDNGKGFEEARDAPEKRNHFGLQIMRARAERLGGKLLVESRVGEGTRVTLIWPSHPDIPNNGRISE